MERGRSSRRIRHHASVCFTSVVRRACFPGRVLDLAQEHSIGTSILARKRRGKTGDSSRLRRRSQTVLILAALAAISTAAAGRQDAPGQTPPAVSTPPSISGTYRENQTLTADVGEWTGPGRYYDFQWIRCDSVGSSCVPIIGATAQQRLVPAADVRFTLRITVTATNKNGTTVATSEPTPVIAPALSTLNLDSTSVSTTTTTTTTATTTTTTTTTAPSAATYFVGDFDTCNLSQWPDLWDASNGRVTALTSPTFGSTCSAKVVTSSAPDSSVAGDASMVNQLYGNTWEQNRADTWYRAQFLLPSGTDPRYPGVFRVNQSPGQAGWNMFIEWHNPPCSSCPGTYTSSEFGLAQYHPEGKLGMRVSGGDATNPSTVVLVDSAPLLWDHWYDVLVHFVYSPDPNVGLYELWVDGRLVFSGRAATIYRSPDGVIRSNRLQVGHYRGTTDWTDTVYVDGVRVGSSRSSLGG
jgi:hypothetical protein